MTKSSFCTNCGREESPGSVFCVGCGAPLAGAVKVGDSPPGDAAPGPPVRGDPLLANDESARSPKSHRNWIVVGVIAVLVVAGGAAGAVVLAAGTGKSPTEVAHKATTSSVPRSSTTTSPGPDPLLDAQACSALAQAMQQGASGRVGSDQATTFANAANAAGNDGQGTAAADQLARDATAFLRMFTSNPAGAGNVNLYPTAAVVSDCAGVGVTVPLPVNAEPTTTTAPASGLWTATALTITPDSLGAVTVGMSLDQAQQAAGITFDGAGDGFSYPTTLPTGYPYIYVGGTPTVSCVGASEATGGPQVVSTPEGVVLGGSVQSLLSIYGSKATYTPAPPPGNGRSDWAGYVVSESSGNLVFVIGSDGSTIDEIAGGPDIGVNDCTG